MKGEDRNAALNPRHKTKFTVFVAVASPRSLLASVCDTLRERRERHYELVASVVEVLRITNYFKLGNPSNAVAPPCGWLYSLLRVSFHNRYIRVQLTESPKV
jgi:hypothetical protein